MDKRFHIPHYCELSLGSPSYIPGSFCCIRKSYHSLNASFNSMIFSLHCLPQAHLSTCLCCSELHLKLVCPQSLFYFPLLGMFLCFPQTPLLHLTFQSIQIITLLSFTWWLIDPYKWILIFLFLGLGYLTQYYFSYFLLITIWFFISPFTHSFSFRRLILITCTIKKP